ncbi:TPA: hypothetical protein EYG96_01930, partial [Candidatus Gracilibacteria bacterium]|nr:hypothetical protein [Candidatus Gracilibacteria bacterium]
MANCVKAVAVQRGFTASVGQKKIIPGEILRKSPARFIGAEKYFRPFAKFFSALPFIPNTYKEK